MNTHHADELEIGTAAATWLERLKTGDPAARAAFADWLRQSPRHVRHFLVATALERELNECDFDETSIAPESAPALSLVSDASPVPIAAAAHTRRRREWGMKIAALAACVLVAVGIGVTLVVRQAAAPIEYSTGTGEQRSVDLPDGSVMVVNAVSRVQVSYTRRVRDVRLLEGEALFDVAHVSERPFRVHVGDAVVEAVGTQFNVYAKGSRATLAVVEGRVNVSGDGATAAVPVAAGELMQIASGGQFGPPTKGDVDRATSWRTGHVDFEEETLANIAAEMNRYNRTKLVIEGDTAREMRFSGRFRASDMDALTAYLSRVPGIVLDPRKDEVVVRATGTL